MPLFLDIIFKGMVHVSSPRAPELVDEVESTFLILDLCIRCPKTVGHWKPCLHMTASRSAWKQLVREKKVLHTSQQWWAYDGLLSCKITRSASQSHSQHQDIWCLSSLQNSVSLVMMGWSLDPKVEWKLNVRQQSNYHSRTSLTPSLLSPRLCWSELEYMMSMAYFLAKISPKCSR